MMLMFKDEEEQERSFVELIGIMIHLRKWTKEWGEHYGYERLESKKKWEQKADDYIEDLKKRKKIQ